LLEISKAREIEKLNPGRMIYCYLKKKEKL